MEVVQSMINQCPSLGASYLSSADHCGQRLGCRTGMPLQSEHARKAVTHLVKLVMTTSADSVDDTWSVSLFTLVLLNKYSELGPVCDLTSASSVSPPSPAVGKTAQSPEM